MIQVVKGDILLTEAQTIAHGVAPHDHFNSGLALSLKEQWPAMYKDFRHYCQTHNPKPGTAWLWGGTGGKRLVALFTQEAPEGHHHQGLPGKAGIDHVNHSLRELRHLVEKEGLTSVALPKLATGVGGLSWDQVEPIIVKHLGDLRIPVLIYETYHKGVKAQEG